MKIHARVSFPTRGQVGVIVCDTTEYGEVLSGESLYLHIIEKAVEKEYGKRCFWFVNRGIGWEFGQVFEALRPTKNNSNPGNSSVTKSISLDLYIKKGKKWEQQ